MFVYGFVEAMLVYGFVEESASIEQEFQGWKRHIRPQTYTNIDMIKMLPVIFDISILSDRMAKILIQHLCRSAK